MELLTNFSACIGCRLVYSGKITKKRYSSKMYFKRCTNGEWALLSALQGISTSQTIAGLHWAANITRKVKVQERTSQLTTTTVFFFVSTFQHEIAVISVQTVISENVLIKEDTVEQQFHQQLKTPIKYQVSFHAKTWYLQMWK